MTCPTHNTTTFLGRCLTCGWDAAEACRLDQATHDSQQQPMRAFLSLGADGLRVEWEGDGNGAG